MVNAAVGARLRGRHDRAQPRGRRAQRDRGRGRGAPGRAVRLAADGQRAGRVRQGRARATERQRAGVGALRARAARGGRAAAAGAGARRRAARRCPSCSRCCAVVARARARARHRPSLARRDLRRRRRGGRARASRRSSSPTPSSRRTSSAPPTRCALAARGALLQRALTTPYTGKCTWEEIFAATRAVGARAHRLGLATSGRSSTRRSRTGWPSWPTASSRPASARRRSASWRSRTRGGWPVPRRVQVIGAHSADFVWRAGGAVAKAVVARRRRPR